MYLENKCLWNIRISWFTADLLKKMQKTTNLESSGNGLQQDHSKYSMVALKFLCNLLLFSLLLFLKETHKFLHGCSCRVTQSLRQPQDCTMCVKF